MDLLFPDDDAAAPASLAPEATAAAVVIDAFVLLEKQQHQKDHEVLKHFVVVYGPRLVAGLGSEVFQTMERKVQRLKGCDDALLQA
jgi:hypothetical protein